MCKPLLALLVICSHITLTSCMTQRGPVVPLTETERQTLGTIGIAAEASRLETLFSRDTSIVDDGLRAMQDRLTDAGQGAVQQVKLVVQEFKELKGIKCRNQDCLLAVPFYLAVMVVRGAAGGVVGALDRKTYSDPPLMELPERDVIRTVQESIDRLGLPEKLRDEVWEMAQVYPVYHFERLSHLSAAPAKTQDEQTNRANGARYWELRDKGIQTLFTVRIPLIEFRGSSPDDSFQLFVHAETTLLSMNDQSCIRHQTWEYQGRSHRLAEWNQDDAKLFVDELDRGLDLLAQRVTPAFFEKPSNISSEALKTVITKPQSLACQR